jgi:hypothetical protein
MVFTALVACAKGSGSVGGANSCAGIKVGDPVDVNGDGKDDGLATDKNGDGVVDSLDLDGDGTPDALLPCAHVHVVDDAGAVTGGDAASVGGNGNHPSVDAGHVVSPPEQDSGSEDAGPALDIELPIAKVTCGSSTCEIRDRKVCCESWTDQGFGTDSMCIVLDDCTKDGPLDPTGIYWSAVGSPRAVVSLCDGMEDCSANEVCCYIKQGMPTGLGPPWTGPGAGRQCLSYDDCTASGAANGIPTGVASCNDDKDCVQFKGTTCQPEQDNSVTTGDGVKARPHFKVCR